jgi:hypothetical protein
MLREAMAALMARWRGLRWSREDEFGRRSFDGGGRKWRRRTSVAALACFIEAEKLEMRQENTRSSK